MNGTSDLRTSLTLLARLGQAPADQAAWGAFVERYGPHIFGWCRHWRLQEADAQDVTQDVLLRLAAKIHAFRYDPGKGRFRGWLKTLAHHAWRDLLEARQVPGAGRGGSDALEVLHTLRARDDLAQRLEEEFDRELLDVAMARVRPRVEPRTWDAFRLLALDGVSGAEAAAKLAMKVATVYVARSKVQRMLQEELHALDGPGPGELQEPP